MLTRIFLLTGTHVSFFYMGKRNPGPKNKQVLIQDVKDELTVSSFAAAVCIFTLMEGSELAAFGLIGCIAGTSHSLAYSLGKYKALSEKERQNEGEGESDTGTWKSLSAKRSMWLEEN